MRKIAFIMLSIISIANAKNEDLYLNKVSVSWNWKRVCPSKTAPCYKGKFKSGSLSITGFMAAYKFKQKPIKELCNEHLKVKKKATNVEKKKNYCSWKLNNQIHYLTVKQDYVNMYSFSSKSKKENKEIKNFIEGVLE